MQRMACKEWHANQFSGVNQPLHCKRMQKKTSQSCCDLTPEDRIVRENSLS